MTSKELIKKLDSHMRVNKITRKSVADKLGVSSAEVGRKLSADNCGLHEFIRILDAVDLYKRSYINTMRHFTLYCSSFGYNRPLRLGWPWLCSQTGPPGKPRFHWSF